MPSKRIKNIKEKFQSNSMSLSEAVKKFAEYKLSGLSAKFDETLVMEFELGVDGKRSDQMIKSSFSFPNAHNIRRSILVIGGSVNQKSAGSYEIGHISSSDLKSVAEGNISLKTYDIAVTYESMMKEIAMSGSSKALGMAGLMPNVKSGTVFKTEDLMNSSIEKFAMNSIEVKSDKFGYSKVPFAKLSMSEDSILENASSLISFISTLKPVSLNGNLIKSVSISSSMSGFFLKII